MSSFVNPFKMKSCVVFWLFGLLTVVLCKPEEKYTDKYDNIKTDEILDNKRLLVSYIKCVLDEGICTIEGKELKSHIQEALETYCEKCTEVQKKETRHVIGHLINKEPEFWDRLTAKYDPTKKFVTKYENELKQAKP